MRKGQVRASQMIMTYGPGAMVDLPDDSVIVAGLSEWHYDTATIAAHTIQEPRLLAKLRAALELSTLTLRRPPTLADNDHGFEPRVTAWRFPEWFLVQHKGHVKGPTGAKARRLVKWASLERGKFRDDNGDVCPVVPVRFVRACEAGHVDDIDWQLFVHDANSGCFRDLYLEERGVSGDLDEVWVTCACGRDKQMSVAAKRDDYALGPCNGNRPWLGPHERERCDRPARLLIRSASNAYFAQALSVISIPDGREAIDRAVSLLWDNFLQFVENVQELERERRRPDVATALAPFADAQVMDAIKRRKSGASDASPPIKQVEFDALAESKLEIGADDPDGDFFARTLAPEKWQAPWMAGVERVVLVHRLREVMAQVGFTRFEAAGNDLQGELNMGVTLAPLALEPGWLPAVEVRGEGIFLRFSNHAIEEWLKKPQVVARGKLLEEGFDLWKADHKDSKRVFFGLPYVMLHSLSHLLVTAISLECGYPASSLRERVYAAPGRYGVLIYTGSSDAEGTLGGLVEAGRRISQHVRRALELGVLCSNDPVCAYHRPETHDHQPLLGAACHGCLLIAETSCEQHNDFLDRALVVQTVESKGAEFFASAT